MVLELNMDLSSSSVRRQDVHSAAVSTHLSPIMVSQGQHWLDRICGRVLHLDKLQYHLRLCTSPLLLEPNDRPECKGQMLEPGSHLVRSQFRCVEHVGQANGCGAGLATQD